MNAGVFASKYNFGISNSRFETSRCHISPHVPNVRVHSHVSLFSKKVRASKVMYRGSAVNALAVLGIPPQKCHRNGLDTFRQLSSA